MIDEYRKIGLKISKHQEEVESIDYKQKEAQIRHDLHKCDELYLKIKSKLERVNNK